jgi:hypothetical protein
MIETEAPASVFSSEPQILPLTPRRSDGFFPQAGAWIGEESNYPKCTKSGQFAKCERYLRILG